jgi:hypothetical protein
MERTPVLTMREREAAHLVCSECEKEQTQTGASWTSLRLAPLENMRITPPPPLGGESGGMRCGRFCGSFPSSSGVGAVVGG